MKIFRPPKEPYRGPGVQGMQLLDERGPIYPYGFFGGAFNPPTLSHEWIVGEALERVFTLIVAPSYHHPFKGMMQGIPYDDRLTLLRECFTGYGERVLVSGVEKEMGGVSYTVDVMARLMETETGGIPPAVVIGEDLLGELPGWHEAKKLIAGHPFLVMPETGLHATWVRNVLEQGGDSSGLVSDPVQRYLAVHPGVFKRP